MRKLLAPQLAWTLPLATLLVLFGGGYLARQVAASPILAWGILGLAFVAGVWGLAALLVVLVAASRQTGHKGHAVAGVLLHLLVAVLVGSQLRMAWQAVQMSRPQMHTAASAWAVLHQTPDRALQLRLPGAWTPKAAAAAGRNIAYVDDQGAVLVVMAMEGYAPEVGESTADWRGMAIGKRVIREAMDDDGAFETRAFHFPTYPVSYVVQIGAPASKATRLDEVEKQLLGNTSGRVIPKDCFAYEGGGGNGPN